MQEQLLKKLLLLKLAKEAVKLEVILEEEARVGATLTAQETAKAEATSLKVEEEARSREEADAKAVEAKERLDVKEDELNDGLDNKDGLEDLIIYIAVKYGFSSMDENEMFKHVCCHDLETARLQAKIKTGAATEETA